MFTRRDRLNTQRAESIECFFVSGDSIGCGGVAQIFDQDVAFNSPYSAELDGRYPPLANPKPYSFRLDREPIGDFGGRQ